MGQKYRADYHGEAAKNGATEWFTRWMGGPTLALVRACPTPFGPRTVYITGEADTWFSVPACCTYRKRTIPGFISYEESGPVFTAKRIGTIFPFAD